MLFYKVRKTNLLIDVVMLYECFYFLIWKLDDSTSSYELFLTVTN